MGFPSFFRWVCIFLRVTLKVFKGHEIGQFINSLRGPKKKKKK